MPKIKIKIKVHNTKILRNVPSQNARQCHCRQKDVPLLYKHDTKLLEY